MPPEDASVEAIVRFLQGRHGDVARDAVTSDLRGPERKRHPNLGEIEVYTGSIGEFWIATASHSVLTYWAPPRFTPTEAKEYAREYLREKVPDFENRKFVRIKREMRDPIWVEEYREEPKEGEVSIFMNWIVLQVNLERRSTHYFNASNLRRVRMEPTRLDEPAARELALARHPNCTIESIRLMEHTTDGGATFRTIWHVVLSPSEPDEPLRLLSLDADTGEEVPQ